MRRCGSGAAGGSSFAVTVSRSPSSCAPGMHQHERMLPVDEFTAENSPTLAVHAEAAKFGINLSSTEAAYIAEAALAASGLRISQDRGVR
jgi:hypothetical protein